MIQLDFRDLKDQDFIQVSEIPEIWENTTSIKSSYSNYWKLSRGEITRLIWKIFEMFFSLTHIYLNLEQLKKYFVRLYSVETILMLVNVSGEMHF